MMPTRFAQGLQRRLAEAPVLSLLIIALVFLGLGMGWRWPWPADEPRFALIAQEMITTHQWLIPHRAGELYPDKPPIFMWLIALGILVTGSLKVAFLLPSLLGALATLGLTTDLTRRLYGPRIAWLAGLTLLLTAQFTLQARTAQIDMLVTGFITLGLYGALRHALLGPAPGWWYLGCVSMGLGVITKGVGFLPLLLLPAWFGLVWYQRRHAERDQRVVPLTLRQLLIGLGLVVAAIACWVIPMVLYTSFSGDPALAAYRDNILFRQTGQRYADSWHHLKPFYYYLLEVLPWAWLPGVLALPWVALHWWRRLRRGDARLWLPLSWVILMVLFFSMSPGKRGVYMTPGMSMFVLALAPALPGLIRRPGLNRIAWGLAVALGGVIGIAGLLLAVGLLDSTTLGEDFTINPWGWWLSIGVLTALIAWRVPPRRGLVSLGLWLSMFWILWASWGYGVMDAHRSRSALMAEVALETGHQPLALIDFDEENVLQAQQPIVQFGDGTPVNAQFARMTAWLRAAPDTRWALVQDDELKGQPCVERSALTSLEARSDKGWWLLRADSVAQCRHDEHAAPLYQAPTTWHQGSALHHKETSTP